MRDLYPALRAAITFSHAKAAGHCNTAAWFLCLVLKIPPRLSKDERLRNIALSGIPQKGICVRAGTYEDTCLPWFHPSIPRMITTLVLSQNYKNRVDNNNENMNPTR